MIEQSDKWGGNVSNPRELTDASREYLARLVAAGASQCVEQVVAQFPELAVDEEPLLELIYLEHILQQEQGCVTSLDAIITRFPKLHERLVRLWEVDQAIQDGQIGALSMPGPTEDAGLLSEGRSRDTGLLDDESPLACLGRIGEYHCVEVLGRGGMGVVYRGIQQRLGRVVAVKTIDAIKGFADPAVSARLLQEARLCAKLQHENIVQVFESALHEGVPYFSMELVAEGNLLEVLAEGPLQPRTAAQLVATLARAVAYAHSQSILHRDLKPANVLLAPCRTGHGMILRPGSEPVIPKLTDFGLAKCLSSASLHTHAGVSLGTPSYMAPEQVSHTRPVDHRADVYALGAILYHTLSGRPPFQAATVLETLHDVCYRDPLPLATTVAKLPRDLDTICSKALSKDPSRRYSDAAKLSQDLDRFLNGRPIEARATGWWERSVKWAKRHPARAVSLAAIVLIAVVTSALWYRAEQHWHTAELAVEDARIASTQTLATLRTLTHDIVFDKFTRQDELSDDDRAFLNRVGEMYEELSRLPHQSEDRRLIRAEGLFYSGLFQRQVSDFEAAHRYFDQAVKICEAVYQDRPSEAAFFRLADSFEQYAAVAEERNQWNMAKDVALRWIDRCRSVTIPFSMEGESRRIVALAKGYQQLANLHAIRNELAEARRLLHECEHVLRRHLSARSGDDACRSALANTLRSLSSTTTEPEKQLAYAEQAIQLLRELLNRDPEELSHRYSLCWAIYDQSYALEANGAIANAAGALDEPVTMLEALNAARPLFSEGRQILAYVRGRRGQLYLALADFERARLDYDRSLELARSLLDRAPASYDIHRRIVRSAVGVAQVLVAEGNVDAAYAAINTARDAIDALRAAIPNFDPQDKKVLECEMILKSLEASLDSP
jgi:tetratricopeptide (TPR) repeat protein